MLYVLQLTVLTGLSLLATVGAGRLTERWLRIRFGSASLTSIAGFGVLGTAFVWLLLLGAFVAPVVAILVIASTVFAFDRLIDLRGASSMRRSSPQNGFEHPGGSACNPWLAALAVVVTTLLLWLTLYPLQGFDFRSYQFPMAQGYAASGGWQWFEDLRFPTFPPLMNAWFATTILFGGASAPVLAQILALLPLLWTALLIVRWARELGAPYPWWAAAALIGSPLVIWSATFGFVDVAMAALITASLYALYRYRKAATEHSWGWLVLSGLLIGAAMNVKYLAAFFVPLVAAALVVGSWLNARQAVDTRTNHSPATTWSRRYVVPVVTFIAPAFLAAGPWYLKTWAATGNPIFPFLKSVFGENPWGWRIRGVGPGAKASARETVDALLSWDSYNPWMFAALIIASIVVVGRTWFLLRSTLQRQRPELPASTWFDPRLAVIEVGALSYFLTMLAIAPDRRYSMPAVALFSLLAAVYFGRMSEWVAHHRTAPQGLRRSTQLETWGHRSLALMLRPQIFGLLLAGLGSTFVIHQLVERPRPPLAHEFEQYLEANVEGYGALRWIQTSGPEAPTVYRINTVDLAAFAQQERQIGDLIGPRSYDRLFGDLKSAQALTSRLQRWGVDLVLVKGCEQTLRRVTRSRLGMDLDETNQPLDPRRRRRQSRLVVELFEELHRSGGVCVYRIK